MNDDRPPLRNWAITALFHGTKDQHVELRIERKCFERNEGLRSRLRLVYRPGLSEGAVMDAGAWSDLAPVLRAAGAIVVERPRTKEDELLVAARAAEGR